MNNIPTIAFDKKQVLLLKEEIKSRGTVFEANLMKAIENVQLEDWSILDATWMIKFYVDTMQNAEKANPKTWEMIVDHDIRMKAMDKLTKIMTGMTGNSKWVTVNIQNNTQNLWNNIPKPWEHLIH